MDQLEEINYFATTIYAVEKRDFLSPIRAISDKYLEESKNCLGKNMTVMTQNFSNDPEALEFAQYVSQTAWNILASQGYAMNDGVTYFTEMWTQEHNHLSSMETHVHGHGVQISAFYFIDVPADSCKVVIHDPRPGKVIINLPEKSHNEISLASSQIVLTPEPGALIFANAWLPHSFTKNMSHESMRFVHMNLSVAVNPSAEEEPQVEVI